MQLRRFVLIAPSIAILLSMAITPSASAASFSSLIVYGDSLSDNGNLFKLTGGIVPAYPPYSMGRFSNGPVTAEQLAADLGVPLYDFAVGGATSGIGNYVDSGTQTLPGTSGLPGIKLELLAPQSTAILASPLTPTSLFLVWGGANDFLTGGSPQVAAANIDAIVATLFGDGAKHILVPGMPDLGLTPSFFGSALATGYSQQFNTALLAGLPKGATYFDTYGLIHQFDSNPGVYGFTDVTDACFNGVSFCANPNQYLFFDGFHPTTAADAFVARNFVNAVITPEPPTILLLSTGIASLMTTVRRRRTP